MISPSFGESVRLMWNEKCEATDRQWVQEVTAMLGGEALGAG